MSLDYPIKVKNDKPSQVVEVECDCDFLWSLATQFSYVRLSDETAENEYQLVNLFAARAKRVAATYARFYLETEEGGSTDKIGRYYWMALGAFASKTVACLLDKPQLQMSYAAFMKTVPKGLAQGNFWLFIDIASSHWLYNNYREHFHEGMKCEMKRDASQLEKSVKAVLDSLPFAAKTLGVIDQFKPSSFIVDGFNLIKAYEEATRDTIKTNLQSEILLAIANHEQKAILQELIYNDEDFAWWAKKERDWFRWVAPTMQISFSNVCEVDDPALKSIAPKEMVVENFKSRMKWITKVADKFHDLMQNKTGYMLSELSTMAGWVDSPDADIVY